MQVVADRNVPDPVLVDPPGLVLFNLCLVDKTHWDPGEELPCAGETRLDPLEAVWVLPVVRPRPFQEVLDRVIELADYHSPSGTAALLQGPPVVQFHFLRFSLVS